jgi:hypothetical protein
MNSAGSFRTPTSRLPWLAARSLAGQFAVVFRRPDGEVQLLHHGAANLPGDIQVSTVPVVRADDEMTSVRLSVEELRKGRGRRGYTRGALHDSLARVEFAAYRRFVLPEPVLDIVAATAGSSGCCFRIVRMSSA